MLPILHYLIRILQPVLVPLCFVTAWTFVILSLWQTWTATRDGVKTVKRLHQIPCSGCQFFTGNYYLKCTVRPGAALTEEAIQCPDYTASDRRLS